MPMLILHSGVPAVAVTNRTPQPFVAPPGAKVFPKNDDTLNEILKKLSAIETELGIMPQPEVDPEQQQMVMQRMAALRAAKEAKQQEAEQRKKEFLKRMKKGKRRAERMRNKE
jgi:DNA-binding helix-hairpin-helix protein with protein kinase domain